MAFLLNQKVYHAMTLSNNDVTQKLNGMICNKLPSVIDYLKVVHHVGQAEEKTVPAESVRYREKVFIKAIMRHLFSRFLLNY